MQEKLAEMKSKYMTQVTIRVKPCSATQNEHHHHHLPESPENETGGMLPEPFNVLNNSVEMGLAKQLVISDSGTQIVAVADSITKPSDTQTDFYENTLSAKVQNVVLEHKSDLVIGIVGDQSSGKFFTLFGVPFNTQLCDLDYNSGSYDT